MNVTVSANFRFSVVAIQYAPDGELNITLDSDASNEGTHYRYSAQLGSGQAEEKHSVSCLDDITLYPSPFLVVTGHGYTKHYYAGAERVAARLGAGGLNHDSVCVGNDTSIEGTAYRLFLEARELANKMEYRRPTTSGIVQIDGSAIGGLENFNPDDVPVSMQAEVSINPNRIHETIGTLSPTGQPAHNSEPEVYFYHSDHLGSASWITDSVGDPIQHLQYLPFGEPFVDQRGVGSTYSERFRFTGKEKDEETGYGYFGARYMDHELMTMWLSVDPMTDKYPSISPYAYCAWNPMKLVDPDGNEVAPIYDKKGNFLGTDDQGIQGKAIVMDKENFKQGMSHSDALKRNKGAQGLEGNDAHSKLKKHYAGLKKRPDWDGVVTRDEGIAWAKDHPGALNHPTPDNTLYINAAMLVFGNITTSDFEKGVGKSSAIQTLNLGNFIKGLGKGKVQNTVYALGRVELFLLNESGEVRVVNNEATDYDWNTGGGGIRNALIKCERAMKGLSDNHGFKTYYYGTGKVKK